MANKAKLLVVDDELIVRDSLNKWFREEGYDVTVADGAQEALTKMAAGRFDLAMVDIKMPGVDGVELQKRMHEIDPEMFVIIMTGYASVETAVAALKNGAYDYVSKPFDPDDMAHTVQNALAHKRAEKENERLRETVASVVRPQEMIGQSAAMVRVFEAIQTVGPTDATVLITGESGTGKELCARAIHAASPRHYNPLVVIHCGALAETLLESELFGHEKGAFTGAQYRKKGSFEVADGGTVFLDEIGDISLKTQSDLLRVLAERIPNSFAAAARAEGRNSAAGRPLCTQVCRIDEQENHESFAGGDEPAGTLPLAREYPGTGKRHRARHGGGAGSGTARAGLRVAHAGGRSRGAHTGGCGEGAYPGGSGRVQGQPDGGRRGARYRPRDAAQ
jgi:FixJ family two-component response regulator